LANGAKHCVFTFCKFAYIQYVCGNGPGALAPCKWYCYFLFIDSEWRCLHGCRIAM